MKNFNKLTKVMVVTIALFSAILFVIHSSIIFGLIGAVCTALLYMENDTINTNDNE